LSRIAWVSRYQKGKTGLDLNKASDDEVLGCSGISWTVCKQSAPRFIQTTTPTTHHSDELTINETTDNFLAIWNTKDDIQLAQKKLQQ